MLRTKRAPEATLVLPDQNGVAAISGVSVNGSSGPASDQRVSLIRRLYDRWERLGIGAIAVTLVIIAWQVCAVNHIVNPLFTSYPSQIWFSMINYFTAGTGWADLAASSQEFAIGFALALGAGIPIGILSGWFRRFDATIDPLVSFLYNSPRIALAPLFVIWFGIGEDSKIAVVFLTAMFPIIINARAGVANTDSSLVAMARSYGAKNMRVLAAVVLPGSVPAISSGIRIAIGQGFLGVVLAEFIASTKGLGYVINTAAANFNTARLFDAVIIISILGITMTTLFRQIEHYFDRWRT